MARKTFLNWLFSADKKPLYVDDNIGHVLEADAATFKKPDDQPAHLKHDPSGWKDTLVKYGRNIKYMGLFRDMTVSMKFVGDGAKILRNRMWLYGIECVCYFGLHKLDRLNFPFNYLPWYSCEIDFGKFEQGKTYVKVLAMEGGISKYLKAYEGTTYEIPINTDVQKKLVYLDGLPFTNTVEYTIFEQDIKGDTFDEGHEFWQVGLGIISNEGTTQGVLAKDGAQMPYPVFELTNNFIKSITKDVVVKIQGLLDFTSYGGHSYTGISIHKYNGAGAFVAAYNIYNLDAVLGLSVNKINYSFDITLAPGDALFFTEEIYNSFTYDGYIHIFSNSFLKLTYDVKFDATFVECLTPYRAFEQIVSKMTEGKFGVQSEFLKTLDDELLLTSGPALRKYEAKSALKTSLLDFFQSFKRYGIGLGIIKDAINGDKLIIERLSYFFRADQTVVDLGEVADLVTTVAEDLIDNTIKVGYKNQKIDKINGRDEINVTQQYTTPITRIVKELDLVSVYRADMYGIEVTRIDLEGQDTTDNQADQDVFMLNVAKEYSYTYWDGDFTVLGPTSIQIPKELRNIRTGDFMTIAGAASNNGTNLIAGFAISGGTTVVVFAGTPLTGTPSLNGTISITNTTGYKLNRPAYTSISGLLHPDDSYNIELSPKRSLINNGPFIRSFLDFMDIQSVKFRSSEKNSDCSTTIDGITIAENAYLPIAGMGDKLFRPYYFSFTTKVPVNYLELINNQPYGLIKFTYNSIQYNGFMWDGGIKPGNNDKQTWKLLCGHNCDISKLIDNG